METDYIREPIDLTREGACSRCGGCCSSLLPVTEKELRDMKAAADKAGYVPPPLEGVNTAVMNCPFLLPAQPDGAKHCAIYENRPPVCRCFSCASKLKDTAKAYVDLTKRDWAPNVTNVWSAYDRTGLKLDGKEIPYRNARKAELTFSDGSLIILQIGHPISFTEHNGHLVPPSLLLEIHRDSVSIFDAGMEKLRQVCYSEIDEILLPHPMAPKTPGNRKQRRAESRKKGKT